MRAAGGQGADVGRERGSSEQRVLAGEVRSAVSVRAAYLWTCRLRACLDAASPDDRVSLVFPPPSLCTGEQMSPIPRYLRAEQIADNAAMIAWAAMDRFLAGDTDPYSIESKPQWSLEELEGEAART